MTRKILINGRREEELRVAIVENQTLEDFEIETKHSGQLRNNIYRGVVSNIAPSLNAAFIDFGDSRNGFLAFNDVVESVYCKHVKDANRISDVLQIGQTLIVQVIKDATTLKGAQVTTNISLAGRYLVLRPKDAKSGVSRKVDDDARADLTQKVRSLDLPEGYGCIVRTNAMDQSRAILLRDAKVLVQLWHKIEAEFARGTAPQMLYNDQDIVVQAMRDYFDSSINEVLIDDKSCYERAKTYIKATVASGEDKIKLYDDRLPLFTRYGIEKQIEQIYARTVQLPSGGFIVIDPTEALTAIDVNSAHSTKRESQDLTAYHTNLEAAVEIGRQLRMRDIGGLIVIDFIDMRQGKHQRDVERVMRNAMARDKARNKVERISANGLLEINRQRISQALSMRTHLECPTCGGRGFIPSAEAIGMTLIREIDARAVNGELGGVIIKLHPDIAQQLQNERRREFAQLELEYGIRIEIVASRDVSRGDESIEWLTKRQENELHPERAHAQAMETASIIDVAEAYQSSDSEDDAYRPNDFEEFSSEEARKKRAAKRAARREQAEAAQAVEAEHVEVAAKAEKPAKTDKADRADAKPAKSDKADRADTVKAAKADRVDAAAKSAKADKAEKLDAAKPAKADKADKTDKSDKAEVRAETKKITGSRNATGLAVLGILLEQMRGRMESESHEGGRSRRHMSFRARRRNGRAEGLQSDIRLFVMDVLKSVCLVGCGCCTDVTRREMLDRIHEASDWLMSACTMSANEMNRCVIAMRNQVASRHATARLNCLFDGSNGARIDELTRVLLEERDAAFGQSEEISDASLKLLVTNLETRCANIFGQAAAPSTFDTSDIESILDDLSETELDDAFAGFDAPPVMPSISEMNTPAAAIEAVSPAKEEEAVVTASGRRRSHRRRAIGEDFVSPYAGENAEIITSDVEIKALTILSDTVAEESNAAPEIAQAITQELPAVNENENHSGRRQRRRSRGDAEIRRSIDAQPKEAAAEISAPAAEPEKQPAATPAPAVEAAPAPEQPTGRRVRHTRRPIISDVSENERTTLEMPKVEIAAETQTASNAVIVEDEPAIEARSEQAEGAFAMLDNQDSSEKSEDRPRRRRRTERNRIDNDHAAPDVHGQIVEVPFEAPLFSGDGAVIEVPAEAPVVVDDPPKTPAAKASETPAPATETRSRRSERAPRKTRKAIEAETARNAELDAPKAEVIPETAAPKAEAKNDEPKAEKAEVKPEPLPALKPDITQLILGNIENRTTRRVRKTHPAKTAEAAPDEVKHEPVVPVEPAVEAPKQEAVTVEMPKIDAAPAVSEEAPASEEKKPSERRTRRSRRTSPAASAAEAPAEAAPAAPVETKVSVEPENSNTSETSDAKPAEAPRERTRRTRRTRPDAE